MKTKDKVLAFLEKNKGTYISGTKIAEAIEVSRNSVWKAIKQLELDGFEIDAITNKGYCLSENSDQLSAIGIIENISIPELNNQIIFYDVIDSTNKRAKELAAEGAIHGTLVVANEQTDGKGRYGRSFESPKNTGVYMSLIIRPQELTYNEPTTVTAYAAVVVSNVIEELTGKKIGIKWVNDLFYNEKKICGILTEAVTDFESGQIEWIVLGIGLNISTSDTVFSEEVKQKAGSIFKENEISINRNKLVATLLEELLTAHKELSITDLMARYKEKSIVLNKNVMIQQGQESYKVKVIDIDDQGQLIIETQSGNRKKFSSGEIRIILD
ncbi:MULTISPECIES: biotin--[acetyl-CoA-carboxylase] ligase [Vagococcus]|uniref:Bifunctional ligase/repressor BirA n=1 Tax=Vagococcus fluvialis bH819 TaxID=1255619 RepID=A0A1X6WK37_9ENTE|nr:MULTISPECIES: biotin--[acetyl-CoA-carboxylase] ligase [Vagococcus]SLM84683.1 Biotin--protein ligase / Biotin operon repressor [Vagococcus fluvialis bH819]HCM89853.1 biotin--[acetyl-CoA-carboxylase] ligase [Vagococcus sp.]